MLENGPKPRLTDNGYQGFGSGALARLLFDGSAPLALPNIQGRILVSSFLFEAFQPEFRCQVSHQGRHSLFLGSLLPLLSSISLPQLGVRHGLFPSGFSLPPKLRQGSILSLFLGVIKVRNWNRLFPFNPPRSSHGASGRCDT